MEDIKVKIEQEINDIIKDSDKFLVDVLVSKNKKITVYIDADQGLNISDCKTISRELYKRIVENEIYPDGEFALEVSSPGLDQPLRSIRQYQKNVGRLLDVTSQDGSIVEGRLTEVEEDSITLEIKNKKESKTLTIPIAEVSKSIVQPEFK